MLSLPSSISTAAAADQSSWIELYDIYLKENISTPWGNTSTLRLSTGAGQFDFFTPTNSPEPPASQGSSATYHYWPIKRKIIKSQSKSANDKLAIVASNVTSEWASMLAAVDWYDVHVVIRKVPTSIEGPLTPTDCLLVFAGQIDSARVTLEQIQFTLSSSLANFSTMLPAHNMHAACRWRWGDDMCTAVKLSSANRKPKTVDTSYTPTTTYIPSLFTGYADEPVTADPVTDTIHLPSHTLLANHRVRLTGSPAPTGITPGRWYYVINPDDDTFQLATEADGSPIDITSAGTSVTLTSETGLLEDTASAIGTDAVPFATITASSEQSGYEAANLSDTYPADAHWRFSDDPDNPTPSVDIWTPWIRFDFGTSRAIQILDFHPQALVRTCIVEASADASTWVRINSTAPQLTSISTALGGGQRWRVILQAQSFRYYRVTCSKGGPQPWFAEDIITMTIEMRTSSSSSDLVDPLANAAITTSSEISSYEGYRVKTSYATGWKINAPSQSAFGVLDWGINDQGYWIIPDDQAGLKNPLLKPWVTFDFGAPIQLGIWRIKQRDNTDHSTLPRLITLFASNDAANWTFLTYFELPPVAGAVAEINLTAPPEAQYWRINVRTIWGDQITYAMFNKVRAYEGTINYWAHGRITFDSDTPTVALRGISRRITQSFRGQIYCEALPTAPSAGDRFTVERGCSGTFNACAIRGNTENYGGFDSLPAETIIR